MRIKSFDKWLEKVAHIALRSEWCIEEMPEWWIWFNQGVSPDEAVRRLFAMVRVGEQFSKMPATSKPTE